MLVDVELHGRKNPIIDIISNDIAPIRDRVGVYICNHWNFHYLFDTKCERYPELWDNNCYGVCDNIDQFFDHSLGRKVVNDFCRKFVISFVHISKKNQPAEEGWMWNKWGPYIGKGGPICEYLYDEVGFDDGVYTYHIYQIKD